MGEEPLFKLLLFKLVCLDVTRWRSTMVYC